MDGFDHRSYGDGFADVYDDWYADLPGTAACVATVLDLAGGAGTVLELGTGTGRLALPLRAAGLDVRGIEGSEQMVARLRTKPGGADVPVTVGDMADVEVPRLASDPPTGPVVDVAVIAVNTLCNLADVAAQRRCVQGVGRVLGPGGRLVVELFVPGDGLQEPGSDVRVRTLAVDRVVLSVERHDPADQTITGQFVDISEAGIRLRPYHLRYLHPAQLDELARDAGLVPEHRWADWTGTPFDDDSTNLVGVYRRPVG